MNVRDRLVRWESRAEATRGAGILVATLKRSTSIHGADLAGLLSLELFLTLVPITMMAFVLFNGGTESGLDVGALYVRQLHLTGDHASLVMQTFGDSEQLREELSRWQGMFGFLVWGIPTSITLADTFAKAWQREAPPMVEKVVRGAAWFAVYLAASFGADLAGQLAHHQLLHSPVRMAIAILVQTLPMVVLWSLTAQLLVPGHTGSWRLALAVGFTSAIALGPVLQAAEVVAFPVVMDWWTGFGPLGVAMTLLTWSLVQATGWVLAACLGAIMWERRTHD